MLLGTAFLLEAIVWQKKANDAIPDMDFNVHQVKARLPCSADWVVVFKKNCGRDRSRYPLA